MPNITLTLSAAIAGEKTITASSGVIEAEAISQIDIDLEANNTEVMVEIQPSTSKQLRVLLLSSTHYSDLTYIFSDGTTDAKKTLTLDGPQMFSSGNIGAIGVDPTQIKLKMAASGEDATVSIFVARDATP